MPNEYEILHDCMNILEDRAKQYAPDNSIFKLTAKLWSEYITNNNNDDPNYDMTVILDSSDVKMMMALHKIARETIKHKDDNCIDAINYLALYEAEVGNAGITTEV